MGCPLWRRSGSSIIIARYGVSLPPRRLAWPCSTAGRGRCRFGSRATVRRCRSLRFRRRRVHHLLCRHHFRHVNHAERRRSVSYSFVRDSAHVATGRLLAHRRRWLVNNGGHGQGLRARGDSKISIRCCRLSGSRVQKTLLRLCSLLRE
ncbi:unnamed protein product [Ectocarpus sp. 12 AP-2014]